jgi:2-polyprenyl-3-methyl-5-hydroxy-6-metoxy-1,4-benzoquinol methylase
MKKIEGKADYHGKRFGCGCLSVFGVLIIVVIVVAINFILSGDPLGIQDGSSGFFFLIVVISLITFGIGYFASNKKAIKTVRFEINEENHNLVIFVDDREIFNEFCYSFDGSVRTISTNESSRVQMLFLLQIDNKMGRVLKYGEHVQDGQTLDNISVSSKNSAYLHSDNTIDPYPSFIYEVYQALKKMEETQSSLSDESEERYSPFESTKVLSYSYEEEKNKARWNETTEINSKSDFYNLEAFKSNKDCLALDKIEKSAFGDVTGKSLLHLQCHFGMSTLSFARMGADVTGVDFSDKAINLASSLSKELSIPANFVRSNIYDLRENLSGKFDYVFTSYGVLTWLKDIPEWARIVAHFLKPGGTFFISEFHPFAGVFDDEAEEGLKVTHPYFPDGKPMRFDDEFSYADDTKLKNTEVYEWTHSLEEILDSLLKAGLQIQEYKEYSHARYQMFPFMKRVKRGEYRIENDPIPLMFSVKATKV